MNVLVTGATGFVGKCLIKRLESKGIKSYSPSKLDLDVLCKTDFEKFSDVGLVFHLAGINKGENYKAMRQVNIEGTRNVSEFCYKNGIKLIFFSSSAVYGKPKPIPVNEDDPLKPISTYGKSKLAAEEIIRSYSKKGLESIILRPSNIIGKGQGKDFLIPRIISQIPDGEVHVMNLDSKRDYIDTRDVVDLCIKIAESNEFNEGVYNVASGKTYSVMEILSMLSKFYNFEIVSEEKYQGVKEINLSVAKIRETYSWSASRDLENTLKEMILQKDL